MKKSTIITTIVAFLAAMFMGVSPASAVTDKACRNVEGEWRGGDVCLYVNWVRKAGSNDLLIKAHSVRFSSSYSDGEIGYQGMSDIDIRVQNVVSGTTVHVDENKSTNSRVWRHGKNVNCRSGYCRITARPTVQWGSIFGWPDDHPTLSLTIN